MQKIALREMLNCRVEIAAAIGRDLNGKKDMIEMEHRNHLVHTYIIRMNKFYQDLNEMAK